MPITSLITSALNVAVDFLHGVGMIFNIMNEPVYFIHRPELEGTKSPVKNLDILISPKKCIAHLLLMKPSFFYNVKYLHSVYSITGTSP